MKQDIQRLKDAGAGFEAGALQQVDFLVLSHVHDILGHDANCDSGRASVCPHAICLCALRLVTVACVAHLRRSDVRNQRDGTCCSAHKQCV